MEGPKGSSELSEFLEKRRQSVARPEFDFVNLEKIFGDSLQSNKARTNGVQKRQHINRNYTLFGTRVARYGEKTAIIGGVHDGNQSLYRPGDTLDDGSIIESIGRNFVKLQRNGHAELLHFPDERPEFQSLDTSIQIQSVEVKALRGIFESGDALVNVIHDINVRAVTTDENQIGLEVTGGKNFESLEKLQLKQGHIILHPDGEPIRTIRELSALVKTHGPRIVFHFIVLDLENMKKFPVLVT